jgi:hypothetical protein
VSCRYEVGELSKASIVNNKKKMQFEKLGIKNIMQITVLGVHLYNFCYEFLFCLKCDGLNNVINGGFWQSAKTTPYKHGRNIADIIGVVAFDIRHNLPCLEATAPPGGKLTTLV